MAANKTYAPLPFSYLTGGSAPENGPTYGVKTSVSHENDVSSANADQDPYSIFSGQTPSQSHPGPVHSPVGRKESIDVINPKLDVGDPYLLSMGRLNKAGSQSNLSTDPRYRDTVPSQSEGGNVFFRTSDPSAAENVFISSSGPTSHGGGVQNDQFFPSLQRKAAYTNPDVDNMTRDEADPDGKGGKKLPRFRVDSDINNYQYYSGSDVSKNKDYVSKSKDLDKGMESATNPVWDKYYAGATTSTTQNDGFGPSHTPSSQANPGIRPTQKTDDFNTLLRGSGYVESEDQCCCRTRSAALAVAIVITAIICLGGGFAAGWFIFQVVNPVAATTTTVTTTISPATGPGSTATPDTAPPVSSAQTSSGSDQPPSSSNTGSATTTTTTATSTATSTAINGDTASSSTTGTLTGEETSTSVTTTTSP